MSRPAAAWLALAAVAGAAPLAIAPSIARADDERLAGDPLPPVHPAPTASPTRPAHAAPPAQTAEPNPPADDLARAADVVADVAAPPPVAEPAPAAAAPSDVDLSSLGLDPATGFDDKLNLYGFADFSWLTDHWSRDPVVVPQDTKAFMVGNLNLYLARNLSAQARALAEIRFTFLPNGSPNLDGSITDTTSYDASNFYRLAQWGGIVIERAYAEYDVLDHLTVRGGHWLTPYGIWNTDHGSPVVITPSRPYVIGEAFFPEHQTGLELFGSHSEAGYKIGYHATVSNGRGASEGVSDQDSELAFGGRLALETPWGLKLGGSYYRGRYTGARGPAGAPALSFFETAYGADARFDRGPLVIQGELIVRHRHFPGGAGDGTDIGAYLIGGYRFDRWWNVMPFVFLETERPSDPSIFTHSYDANLGLNFRPTESLVLKAMATYLWFDDGPGVLDGLRDREFMAQAAWAF